jgi:hypothetical protein
LPLKLEHIPSQVMFVMLATKKVKPEAAMQLREIYENL